MSNYAVYRCACCGELVDNDDNQALVSIRIENVFQDNSYEVCEDCARFIINIARGNNYDYSKCFNKA